MPAEFTANFSQNLFLFFLFIFSVYFDAIEIYLTPTMAQKVMLESTTSSSTLYHITSTEFYSLSI